MWKGALYLGLFPPLFFLPLPPLIIWFSSGSSENAACTWQMCGTTAAAYRSVSPLLIQACFLCHKWKFNMRLKTDWELNQQRQSMALTASEQLLMQKIIIKKCLSDILSAVIIVASGLLYSSPETLTWLELFCCQQNNNNKNPQTNFFTTF